MRKAEDLAGKRFGSLVAISRVENSGAKTRWLCRCDCGNEVVTFSTRLKSGTKTHCGCKSKGNITGKRFGKLIAIKRVGKDKYGEFLWECKCDCGNHKVCTYQMLTQNKVKSCGCLVSRRNFTHGLYGTRIRGIYYKMLNRCNCETSKSYDNYGGHGIKVCKEWSGEKGLINFYKWSMDNGYSDELSIDRIDVNGDYCPENCRWTTPLVQQNNRRNNINIEHNGESHTLSQWCRMAGVNYKTALRKYHNNVPLDIILKVKR